MLEEEVKKKFKLVKTSFQVSSLGFGDGINNWLILKKEWQVLKWICISLAISSKQKNPIGKWGASIRRVDSKDPEKSP